MREIAALNAEGTRDELNNPQTILASMKADWLVFAREREKQMVPKLLAEIRDLEAELKEIKTNAVLPDEVKAPSMAALAGQIRKLHEKRLNQLKASGRAKHRIDGERPTKYWTKLHREKKPREVMMAFEKEGLQRRGDLRPTYETNSKKMAEMARDYHDNLQKDSLEEERLSPNREAAIVSALDAIKARVSEDQAEQLGQELTWDECEIALRFSKSGSAPGLDGLPYDLWKTLHARFVEDSRHDDRTPFDVLMLLMSVFRDVKRYGVCETACFADGWMCPIYKEKGERTKIANYRPITLLNTDYKLLTKVLAIRLAEVAPDIVHPSQAGFVPGRRLHNHTQLAKLMIDWAERTEQNGAIIALDQEKAYDKVAHDYLWRVLERFGLPIAFVDCFRKLYTNAKTSVMINGVLSSPFKVYRGVRQGDPISCLLFDLAIEPLSAMIRDSDIVGFQIPGTMEKLKATLFADDTTVYLSEDDDFGVLQGILDKWCLAAKARFNIKKTEVIPIGTPEYRKNMVDTYRVTGQWRNYPQNVRMASDGNVVRMLGAFMGNDAEAASVWSTTLAKVALAIERWKMGISTIEGRRHVVQMIIGGMTQFLTDVQLMPPSVCKRLEGMISQYFWNDRARPPIKMKYIQTPFESGGLKVLDLEARNEAIQVMWLKSYLDFSTSRPLWAFIADDIFARTVTKDCSVKVRELRRNPFLQDWRPKLAELPDTLREMFKIGVKYGIRPEGLAFGRSILREMPMWYHWYAEKPRVRRLASARCNATKCLRDNHKARSVGDFETLAVLLTDPSHDARGHITCECDGCILMTLQDGCEHPHKCAERAVAFLATLPAKWDPRGEHPEDFEDAWHEHTIQAGEVLGDDLVPFDKRLTEKGNLGETFRIFTDGEVCNRLPAVYNDEDQSEVVTVATDGSCLRNGQTDACAGAGVFVADGHRLNQAVRLPACIEQTNQTGEAVATLLASRVVNSGAPMIQETDSQTVMKSVTTWRRKNENAGFVTQKNDDLTRAIIASLRARQGRTYFRWVKGHNGHARNEKADELAGQGARKDAPDDVAVDIPEDWRLSGCKLSSMTQKLAYKAIRAKKQSTLKVRPSTAKNVKEVLQELEAAFGVAWPESMLWRSIRRKEISRECRQFMWMSLHDNYMVGKRWLRDSMSFDLKRRATCKKCTGEIESMEHILIDCRSVERRTTWVLLEELWTTAGYEWKEPTLGTVLGAGCVLFETEGGKRDSSKEALWATLWTESAYLIWKLRCERVIQHEGQDFEFSIREVRNRWHAVLERRLDLDRRSCAKHLGKSKLKAKHVARVWKPVIKDWDALPPDWVTNSGVLVGIRRVG